MKKAADFDVHMREYKADESGLIWINAKESVFGLYGSEALSEEGFCRLTKSERDIIRPLNDGEAWFGEQSAGIQIRFQTNSPRISVRFSINGKFDMTNMSQIGQCGTDLYVYDEEFKEFVLHSVARFSFDACEYQVAMSHFEKSEAKMRKYILYFPLYKAVTNCEIGIEKESKVTPFGFSSPHRTAIYGTSITHGCSASRPGVGYTNIISRKLDEEILNFGFSGTAMMEKEMGEIIATRNIDTLIICTEANAGVDYKLRDRAEDFLNSFYAKKPAATVILYSRILFALDRYDQARINLHNFYNDFLKKLAKKYRQKGYKIYFANGSDILKGNYTEYTIDGFHPTDVGMFAIAKSYINKLNRIRGIK